MLIFLIRCAILSSMRGKYIITVLLIFCVIPFFGCKLLIGDSTNESLEIVVKGDSFTLAWDPGGPEIPNDPNRAVQYKVYYRVHGSYYWRFLMETESSGSPECVITDEEIDYGRYDFAVSAVNEQGSESAFHSSLDRTANPLTGWHINWIGSK